MSRMNNDLISRKALIEEIQSFKCYITGLRAGKGILAHAADEYRKSILQIIEDQPTAFDKEKVIENLTNLANAEVDMSDDEEELVDVEDWFDEGRSQGRFEAYRNSVEIVKKGGIE